MAHDPNQDTGEYDPTSKLYDPTEILTAFKNTKEEDRDLEMIEKVTNKPYLITTEKEMKLFTEIFDKDNVAGFIFICLSKDYQGDEMIMKNCYDWKATDQATFIFAVIYESKASELYQKYGKDSYYAVINRSFERKSKPMAASKFGSIGKKLKPACSQIMKSYD